MSERPFLSFLRWPQVPRAFPRAMFRFGVTEKTARLFMHKAREAMENSSNNPMGGIAHVDEFILGGREKGKIGRSYNTKERKAITAVGLTEEGTQCVSRTFQLDPFNIFVNHISRDAIMTTDK